MRQDVEISRRALLGGAVAGATAASVAVFAGDAAASVTSVAVPTGADRARFLTAAELGTLAALVDRVVPGVPDDTVPGAVAAGCHEAIDALLGAFTVSPPRIYAGGPFSDRGGARHNDFADFLPLDRYETTAWRLRIEGSRGRAALERNGKVPGHQRTYRRGLAALEASVPGGFSAAPGPVRDLALRQSQDPAVAALLDVAVLHTLEFMYGAPEYGGNRRLVGWTITDFDGDVQPRGYTDEQVTDPESSGPSDLAGDLLGTIPPAAMATGSMELVHGVRALAGERFSGIRLQMGRLASPGPEAAELLAQMHAVAERLVAEAANGPAAGGER